MDNQNRNSHRSYRKPKTKKHLVRRTTIIIILLILIIAGFFIQRKYSEIKQSVNKNTFFEKNGGDSKKVDGTLKANKPFTILLMGTDTGSLGRNWVGRTDSLILATVNPKKHTTSLTSIPRDSMISIIGQKNSFPQKINAAYEYPNDNKGHPETTMKTVSRWLNVPINFYALVNMRALEKIVNGVGGVSVKSPLSFKFSSDTAHAYGNNLYSFNKGSTTYKYYKDGQNLTKTSNKMDGAAALAFARMRYEDPSGDYGRTLRQRLILEAVSKKSNSLVFHILRSRKLLNSITKQAKTDLSFNDILTLASHYRRSVKNIESDHLQGSSDNSYGASYQVISQGEKQKTTNKIRKLLNLKNASTGPKFAGTTSKTTSNSNYPTTSSPNQPTSNTASTTSNTTGTNGTYGSTQIPYSGSNGY